MKGKELIDFISKNNLENKDVMCVISIDGGVNAWRTEKIYESNEADDCIFIEVEKLIIDSFIKQMIW